MITIWKYKLKAMDVQKIPMEVYRNRENRSRDFNIPCV
jgi:hypothetical protein